ncbi:tRNA glutamyl-Q(34) synthetase GluQRS [Meridianimarinicoccus sp. MJW13]|uniref:tRNA glutamyl-Q(34) synthetase GluQRS n=1 Tax=Meridianimarinicoccus sp. MJW13 TaxID=2720031 RepID=UPI0018679414|nr:tRNA glutamyl-Q(34) synthetase GluQRS [Fluviibacterium sp. MJW13]
MRTRFAPSPTGPLHLGHAFSALVADNLARTVGGTFLLRIEDIDQSRARPEWEAQIYDDLRWLELDWPEPVMRQSDRMDAYALALDRLWNAGLLYPCTCTRRDIVEALSAPQEGAPAYGPDGPVYPGTCRPAHPPRGPRPQDAVLRLNMAAALAYLGASDWSFSETGIDAGPTRFTAEHLTTQVGDVVLARRGMGTSYHLSVVVDDADQGITHVVRGVDLAEATAIHLVLQDLLGLPRPVYHHHRLIRDAAGKRLAKRDDARAIALFRAEGRTPADIRRMVGL